MLRALLLYLSKAEWAQRMVSGWSIARRVSSRFVAGETLEDAVQVIKTLNAKGIYATLDHLGEHTATADDARNATEHIIMALDAVKREELASGVSIKLTQIGLNQDLVLCAENLANILGYANSCGVFVRIDMEDSPYVDRTLTLFNWMKEQLGYEWVGVVLQSMLYRSVDDLMDLAKGPVRVRLVKGAYNEPPEIAFPKKRDSDENFDNMTNMLIGIALKHGAPESSADGRRPPIPAIGSQDETRIQYAKKTAEAKGLRNRAIEFQMLHGIRRDLQEQLVEEGYPVRVYVPYGSQWYPYLMRRMAERPANLWFFISNLLRK